MSEVSIMEKQLNVGADERSEKINRQMHAYLENEEILSASMLIRQNGQIVYANSWGWTDFERTRPASMNDIYRLMSMTKPVIAVGVMILSDRGKLSIDEPVCRYIPSFKNMRVCTDERFQISPSPSLEQQAKLRKLLYCASLKTETLTRDITIRDLLSHCSGLGQGVYSGLAERDLPGQNGSLEEQVDGLAKCCLDFQPGTCTGYSGSMGFNVLGRIIEVISGLSLEDFCKKEIFEPLDMPDTGFHLTDAQSERLVPICIVENGTLVDVTEKWATTPSTYLSRPGYVSGSGGLFSTAVDYGHFVQMLADGGQYNGKRILKAETALKMRMEAPEKHMEVIPGQAWGLGMRIHQNTTRGNVHITEDAYGWSGAFGTQFLISPKDRLEYVMMLNRNDVAGSESYITYKMDELVFESYKL